MNRMRRVASTRGLFAYPGAAALGGAALSLLYACGLDSSGVNASGEPGSTTTSTSTGAGGEGGAGGAGGSSTTAAGGMGGGAGGMGGGAGGMGGAGGVVGFSWTATDPTQNAGGAGGMGGAGGAAPSPCSMYTYKLPDWLVFESPHTLKSSQTSEESLCVGFGADEPRARNVTAGPDPMKWGLSIESQRTNAVVYSDSWNVGWSSSGNPADNMAIQTGLEDPAGGMNATKFSSTGAQHSRYVGVNARVASAWLRGDGFAAAGCFKPGADSKPSLIPESCYSHFSQQDTSLLYQNVTSSKWRRLSIVHPTSEDDVIALETRNVPTGSGAIVTGTVTMAYAAQGEPVGGYPSSYIPTMDAAVTRAAEALSVKDAKAILPDAYLNVTLKFAPNFHMSEALTEQTATEYNLLYLEAKTRLYLRRDDRTIHLKIENVEVVSDPIAFDREQELTITVEHKDKANIKLTIAGAAAGNETYEGMSANPIDTTKVLYILSKNTGAEECSDLRHILFN